MDPYWLFFKTVVHTVISLMSAAAVLFTSVPARQPERGRAPARSSLVHAAYSVSAWAGAAAVPDDPSSLRERLRNNDPAERARAACAAKKLGDDARPLIKDLAALLADDATVPGDVCGDWGGRWSGGSDSREFQTTPGEKAAAALVAAGSAAYEALAAALRSSQWQARKNAAWALGALDDRRAVDSLIAGLRDAEAPVRRNAAWALGALDDQKAVRALSIALRDSDPGTRSQAAWALGALDSPEAVPGLIECVNDAESSVRSQAAWALGAIDDAQAVPALSRALAQDRDAKVRSQAAWALGAIGDRRASTALAQALKDADAKVRRQAAWALGIIEH
jgi:HEAT repeat protein